MQGITEVPADQYRCGGPSEPAAGVANDPSHRRLTGPGDGARGPFTLRRCAAVLLVLAFTILGTGEAAFGAAKGTSRPIKGSGTGSGYASVTNGVITFTVDGTQRLSHLGRSTFHLDAVCTNADCSGYHATTTYVAANGDTFTTFASVTPGSGFTETITGGTGRFAGATGTMTETGTTVFDPSNPLAFTVTFQITGRISY